MGVKEKGHGVWVGENERGREMKVGRRGGDVKCGWGEREGT